MKGFVVVVVVACRNKNLQFLSKKKPTKNTKLAGCQVALLTKPPHKKVNSE